MFWSNFSTNIGNATFRDNQKNLPRERLFAVEKDIADTIEHPVIGTVKNAASLFNGTNPLVKIATDFPTLIGAVLKIGGILSLIIADLMFLFL